jgi:hypothetical protein
MKRETIFISKATPEDDEFVLWLAPRLEAAGYKVFADILSLEGGDRWRKVVTSTLQDSAIKMLLCCRNKTLEKDGVQEEISIAEDITTELKDARFIIPLKLESYKKIFGISSLQYVDFVGSWASGLKILLDTLEKQYVPRSTEIAINPNWENYKKRLEIKIVDAPELLTSSWLQVSHMPKFIRYYQPIHGISINHDLMIHICNHCTFPAEAYLRGFFSFAVIEEIEEAFASVGKFVVHSEHNLQNFLDNGSASQNIRSREAQNLILSILRKSWENFCRMKGFYEYPFAKQLGFHITKNQIPIGTRITWSKHGESRRSSMLRNVSGGKVWQYGVSAVPYLWPFPQFRIKARVLFSELMRNEAGACISDHDEQHRLRRTICKGWRNKAWHGRMMAFLKYISGESNHIELPLSNLYSIIIDAIPISVTSPVTTNLPDIMSDEEEELDPSTLGNFDIEDEE